MKLFAFQKIVVDHIVHEWKTGRKTLSPSLIPLGYGRAVIICAAAKKLKKETVHVYLNPCLVEQWQKIIKREKVKNIILHTTGLPVVLI